MTAETAQNNLEETIEVKHESPLYAEEVFEIKGFPITNSLINSFIVVVLVVIFGLSLRGRIKMVPKGLQNVFEIILEALLGLFDSVTHSRK